MTEALIRVGETERAAEDVDRYEVRYGHIRRHRISYLRSLAVLTEHRGETSEAILHLQEARTLAREIGLPGEVWVIESALDRLSLKQGDHTQARAAFGEAATTVHFLADRITDDKQRILFLTSEQARIVIENHAMLQ